MDLAASSSHKLTDTDLIWVFAVLRTLRSLCSLKTISTGAAFPERTFKNGSDQRLRYLKLKLK